MSRHLTYANVCSTLGLFLAVSTGGAYAAERLLTGKQIRNSSLTGADVRNASLSGADVRDGSLASGDLRDGSVSAADLAASARVPGPKGETGAKGDPGPEGRPGAAGAPGAPGAGSFGDGSVRKDPFPLAQGGDWVTITDSSFTAPHDGRLVFGGAVESHNTDKAPGAVELRIVHNGHAHELPSGATVGPAALGVGHVSFLCSGARGPVHIELQARATGAAFTIGDRSLTTTLVNPLD